MSKKAQTAQWSFAQGEVSDLIDARVDVQKRGNGARVVENFWNLPEGGLTRRPGTHILTEVKTSSAFTRIIPFEYSTEDAFILEFGNNYIRFFKNRARIMNGPVPYEIASSYLTADLRDIHYEQSADYMFMTSLRQNLDIQKITRIEDDEWILSNFSASPPPTFEALTDISGGAATLTPAATTGSSVVFTASGPVFFLSDVARNIIYKNSVAIISSIGGGGTTATCTILSAFPNTNPIPAGDWFLDGSPKAKINPQHKGPVGKETELETDIQAFRAQDLGKHIRVYEGIIKIYQVVGETTVTGLILKELSGWVDETTPEDPAETAAGAWRLEEESWSPTYGYPSTLTIHSGRLYFAGSPTFPSTLWGSSVTDIYSFATGPLASDAIQYDFQHGKENRTQWLLSLQSLYLGDANNEYFLRGSGVDKPLTATEAPYESHIDQVGSLHVQPLLVDNAILLIQGLGQDVVQMRYSLNESPDTSSFVSTELTIWARHIGDMGFALHKPIYVKKPYSMCFFPLDNGQLAGLTFKPRQEVSSWSRAVTDGEFESLAVVPHENRKKLTHYVVVKRTINGATKRYIEYFEDDDPNLQTRTTERVRYDERLEEWVTDDVKWSGLVTDCAGTGTILNGASSITGITWLVGETVDVIIGDTYVGQKVVSAAGVVTLDAPVEEDLCYEVGLHFDPVLTTIRPNPQGDVVEGVKRHWPYAAVRVKDTIGGKINGKILKKDNAASKMYTGICKMENVQTKDPYDGALTITQPEPYPMTILGVSGTIAFGDTSS